MFGEEGVFMSVPIPRPMALPTACGFESQLAGPERDGPRVPCGSTRWRGASAEERSFVGGLESVADARVFTATFLTVWDAADHVADVQLCVSELATNSLIHGGGSRDGFRLRLAVSDHRLNVAVTDSGSGRPVRQTAEWDSASGRGLLIVNEMADRWGVEEHSVGKTVWAEFERLTAGGAHVARG